MVSGTYVLTDSIKGAFDAIFTQLYQGTDAIDHRQVGLRALERDDDDRAARSTSRCSPRVRGAPGRRGRDRRRRRRGAPDRRERQGDRFGGAPNLGFSVDPTQPAFNSLTLVEGAWPEPNEVVDRQVDRGQEAPRGRRHDRRPGARAGAADADLRPGQVRSSELDLGGATLAGFDLPTAQTLFQQAGQARPDPRRRRSRASRRAQLAGADPGDPAAADAGANAATRRPRRTRSDTKSFLELPPGLPARVRRHRALRRQRS